MQILKNATLLVTAIHNQQSFPAKAQPVSSAFFTGACCAATSTRRLRCGGILVGVFHRRLLHRLLRLLIRFL